MDPRIVKLADLLVDYSCRVQTGDKVLIDYEGDCCKDLVRQLIKKIYAKGGLPYVDIRDSAVTRELLLSCSEEQIAFMNECSLQKMKGMQAYIAIRAGGNTAELSDVPSDKLNMYYRLTSRLSTIASMKQNGSCFAIRTTPWRSWQTPALKPSKTFILTSALWITAKWIVPWMRLLL